MALLPKKNSDSIYNTTESKPNTYDFDENNPQITRKNKLSEQQNLALFGLESVVLLRLRLLQLCLKFLNNMPKGLSTGIDV